jgi:hypothetical protein
VTGQIIHNAADTSTDPAETASISHDKAMSLTGSDRIGRRLERRTDQTCTADRARGVS